MDKFEFHKKTFSFLYDVSMSDSMRIKEIIKNRLFFTKQDCDRYNHKLMDKEVLTIDMINILVVKMKKSIEEYSSKKGIKMDDELFREKWITIYQLEEIVNMLLFKQTSDAIQLREIIKQFMDVYESNGDIKEFIDQKLKPIIE